MPTPTYSVLSNTAFANGTTLSLVVPAGTSMLVVLTSGSATSNLTALTWNTSESMTSRAAIASGNAGRSEIWDLVSPTAGSLSLVITGGSGNRRVVVFALAGVNVAAPRSTAQTKGASVTGSALTVTVTTQAGDLVLSTAEIDSNSVSLTDASSQTMINNAVVETQTRSQGSLVAVGTSTSITYTVGSSVFGSLAAISYHGSVATIGNFLGF